MFTQFFSTRSSRITALTLAGICAILIETLLWGKTFGVNAAVFTVLALTGFGLVLELRRQKITNWPFVALFPVTACVFSALLYNNDFSSGWNILLLFVSLLFIAVTASLSPKGEPFRILSLPIIRHPDGIFDQWGQMLGDIFSFKKENKLLKQIIIGFIIALPLLLIFGSLFASADTIFNDLIKKYLTFNLKADTVGAVIRVILISWSLGSLFYVTLRPEYTLEKPLAGLKPMEPAIFAVVLSLINALFLVFVIIQLRYLFGGFNFVVQNGLTFADYARQGFFQLAAVMGLSALIILGTYRSYHMHARPVWLGILKAFLLIQVAIIGVSALKRMHLYQEVYGFTVLRLYVEWFIYAMFAVLATLFAAVWYKKCTFPRLVHTLLAGGALVVALVGLRNVDLLIANQNINRFITENKPLDLGYLQELSIDVIPALTTLVQNPATLNSLSILDKARIYELYNKATTQLANRQDWREKKITDQEISATLATITNTPNFKLLLDVHNQQISYNQKKNSWESKHKSYRSCEPAVFILKTNKLNFSNCTYAEAGGSTYILEYNHPTEMDKNIWQAHLLVFPGTTATVSTQTQPLFEHWFNDTKITNETVTSYSYPFALLDDGSVLETDESNLKLFQYYITGTNPYSLQKTEL